MEIKANERKEDTETNFLCKIKQMEIQQQRVERLPLKARNDRKFPRIHGRISGFRERIRVERSCRLLARHGQFNLKLSGRYLRACGSGKLVDQGINPEFPR